MDTLCQWAEAHGQIQKTGMDLILSVRVWYIRPEGVASVQTEEGDTRGKMKEPSQAENSVFAKAWQIEQSWSLEHGHLALAVKSWVLFLFLCESLLCSHPGPLELLTRKP